MSAETIKQSIYTLIEKSGHSSADITFTYDEKTETFWFSLPSTSARILLGRGGEALTALNHLAAKLVEKIIEDAGAETTEKGKRPRVIIDAGDFEKKKIDNIKTIAHMMAERARYFKSSISVDPMSAQDRRTVHEHLAGLPDITTESEGVGKDRHVVIKYKDPTI